MSKIRGILFDNDGTLVDTYHLILSSFQHATKAVLGKTIPEERLMQKVGQPLAVQMWDFSDNEKTHDALLRTYRSYNHAIHDDVIAAFPGVIDGLEELCNRGYKLGVVTGKMHHLAWRGLEVVKAAPYLECCVGADDCPRYRPDPEPIIMGAQALGIDPAECIYVGDSPYDIAAGHAARCQTIACLWGMFSAEALAAENPTFTCTEFSDILALLP